MLTLLVRIAVFAFVGYVIWRMMRPRYSVKIVIDDHGIQHHEGLPRAQEKKVLGFLQDDIGVSGKLIICALRQPNGYLRLNFKGHVDPGTQQQIRNFLNTVM